MLGREQEITVGPMSGEANVVAWLEKRDIVCTPEEVKAILTAAKDGDHVLSEDEIHSLIDAGK